MIYQGQLSSFTVKCSVDGTDDGTDDGVLSYVEKLVSCHSMQWEIYEAWEY